jgi:hypothetical protein
MDLRPMIDAIKFEMLDCSTDPCTVTATGNLSPALYLIVATLLVWTAWFLWPWRHRHEWVCSGPTGIGYSVCRCTKPGCDATELTI